MRIQVYISLCWFTNPPISSPDDIKLKIKSKLTSMETFKSELEICSQVSLLFDKLLEFTVNNLAKGDISADLGQNELSKNP